MCTYVYIYIYKYIHTHHYSGHVYVEYRIILEIKYEAIMELCWVGSTGITPVGQWLRSVITTYEGDKALSQDLLASELGLLRKVIPF